MKSYWGRMSPYSERANLETERKREERREERGQLVIMEAEIRVLYKPRNAKNCQKTTEIRRKAWNSPSLPACKEK
jgi:hypothetical protein